MLLLEVNQNGDRGDRHQGNRESGAMNTVGPWKLEIHAKKARDDDQRQSHGTPDGKHFHHFIGAIGDGGKIDIERARQQVPVRLDQFDCTKDVVVDVAEIDVKVVAQQPLLPASEIVHNFSHARGYSTELHQFALERKDLSQRLGIRPVEDHIFYVGNVVGDFVEHRLIAVDDLVDDHVEQPIETVDVLLLGSGTNALEYRGVVAANGDQKIGTKEEIDIIELEFSLVVHVLQHRENVVVVFLRLGPLRPMATVLDLQLVQLEAAREFVEIQRCWIGDVIPRKMRKDGNHVGQF